MCIIASKPAGVAMPDDAVMEMMWDNNPDGAGFMYWDSAHQCVRIEKGFMKYTEFYNALEKLGRKKDLTQLPLVLHFRIATHGGINQQNTHPFPITNRMEDTHKLRNKTSLGIVHNGIISGVTPRAGASDTTEYIMTYLYPIWKEFPNFFASESIRRLIQSDIKSKMTLMDGQTGNISLIGDFTVENGIAYSNGTYKQSKYYYPAPTTYAYKRSGGAPSRAIQGVPLEMVESEIATPLKAFWRGTPMNIEDMGLPMWSTYVNRYGLVYVWLGDDDYVVLNDVRIKRATDEYLLLPESLMEEGDYFVATGDTMSLLEALEMLSYEEEE